MPQLPMKPPGGTPVKLKSKITLIGATGVSKADKGGGKTAAMVVNGADNQPDDTFAGSYITAGSLGTVSPIEPTFLPLSLKLLVSKNNILNQCVEVMEVNIDGTGHTFEKIDENGADFKEEKQTLEDFFAEPYPGKSMIGIRRNLRSDLEGAGWGTLEVARNPNGDIMTLNNLECETMRLIRFDEPVWATKTVTRNGKPTDIQVRVRERRFVQMVNNVRTYFKEFGASRELSRSTGKWADKGVQLPADDRASEVLYFTVNKEVRTPYGSPRWINQLPSVMGSRKAEEFNLEFFDSGGLPPVLVLVQGGYLGTDVKDALTAHLAGSGAKHRACVVEAIAASGSLDSAGTVKVTVERFGTERQQDSMFQQYDKNCEEHVRTAFRLPPIFIGRAQDYNFATAMTGYMTAEAQVFAPERLEFDERMDMVVKALGSKNYKFKSKPMTLSDMETQLEIITLALTNKVVDPQSAMDALNKMGNLKLEFQAPPVAPEPPVGMTDPVTGLPYKEPLSPKDHAAATGVLPKGIVPKPGSALPKPIGGPASDPTKVSNQSTSKVKATAVKKEDVHHLVFLADAWANVLGLRGPCAYDDDQIEQVKKQVSDLGGDENKVFNELLAMQSLVQVNGAEGLAQLCGCAAELVMQEA